MNSAETTRLRRHGGTAPRLDGCGLKGHHSALFSYNGKLVEVTGTANAANKSRGILWFCT